MGEPGGDLLARCMELSVEENLALYVELLDDSELVHEASLPALALREKARAGLVDVSLVPLLVIALVDAPNLAAMTHLAKALATFGRAAQSGAPYLCERLAELHITSDRRFWVLDSCLWALGYLGGDVTRAFLVELDRERPSRVLRSKSVYEGELGEDERERLHRQTLVGATELAAREDAVAWLDKRTTLRADASGEGPRRLAPWMTR